MGRSRKNGRPIHGWVVLDKPLGMTSTTAVARVRGLFEARKAGHAGTLDPLATGLLAIALGDATKTVPHLMGRPKRYRFTLAFGAERTTDDLEGTVTQTSDARPADADIRAALPEFVGVIPQIPPVFSAIRVDGARAYDLARAGDDVVLAPRPVRIDALELLARPDPDHAVFEVACGQGTYVRSLARDLARRLGTSGHVATLRRTATGPFTEASAISLETLTELRHKGRALGEAPDVVYPVETVLDDIPALALTSGMAAKVRQGQAVPVAATLPPMDGDAYAMADERLLALGDVSGGLFHPRRVFTLDVEDY